MSERLPSSAPCPETGLLEQVLAGGGEAALRRAVVRHLLSGCTECRAVARRVTGSGAADPDEPALPSLAELMTRLEETSAGLESERERARALIGDFLGHPPARQWTLLRNSARFDIWAFAELLSAAAYEAIYDDPHRSLELSRMALEVIRRLEPGRLGNVFHDLCGRILGRLGNAQRAIGDLAGAEASLAAAQAELEQGSGDPLEEADLLYFLSSLRRAQRRIDDALRLVRRSRRLSRELGDRQREARAWVGEGTALVVDGDYQRALDAQRRALELVDERADPRLALAARHNVLFELVHLGRTDEALRELELLRPRYLELNDRSSLLRLRWMEGQLARKLEQGERAEAALRDACEGFVAAELPYDAAVVGLDLALVLAEAGRHAEVARLAAELAGVFRSLGVGRETIAAWMVFEGAARAQLVTAKLVERMAAYLAEVRHRPGLAFEPDSA